MPLSKLKKSVLSKLKGDEKHCHHALEQLLNEVPYDKMQYIGKLTFNNFLKRSLKKREEFQSYKLKNKKVLDDLYVNKPIFITGLPRSGTTLLQNLLIKNLAIEGIQFWELLSPIPQIDNKYIDQSFRKIKAHFLIEFAKLFGPKINSMHPMSLFSYEECWHLFLITFNIINIDLQLCISNYGKWIEKHSIGKAYEEYAEILKIIISNRKKSRIILKCPEHMLFTDNINHTFPDSKIIWIHRDPIKSITSYTNMVYEIQKFFFGHSNKAKIANSVSARFQKMIEKITFSKDKLGIEIIDIKYHDLIDDQKNTVQNLSEKCLATMQINICENKKQNLDQLKSKIKNEPEKLGIDTKILYNQFNDYMKRFNISKEII